jgi:hypothetical protein
MRIIAVQTKMGLNYRRLNTFWLRVMNLLPYVTTLSVEEAKDTVSDEGRSKENSLSGKNRY